MQLKKKKKKTTAIYDLVIGGIQLRAFLIF